jgi:hypothetical protein
MAIHLERLDAAIAELKTTLRDGLIATDIWDRTTGLPLVGLNSNPTAVALLTNIIANLNDHLDASGFPQLDKFFFAMLENNEAIMIIAHGEDLLQGVLVDMKKTNIGVLLSVALPRMLARVNIPPEQDALWARALTGPEPKVSALATRLLIARLRDEVKRAPDRLAPAIAQLRGFFANNAFALRDLDML